jgi:hypothetical protein
MKIRWLLFFFLIVIYGTLKGQNLDVGNSELALKDRWIECDLLWFKPIKTIEHNCIYLNCAIY